MFWVLGWTWERPPDLPCTPVRAEAPELDRGQRRGRGDGRRRHDDAGVRLLVRHGNSDHRRRLRSEPALGRSPAWCGASPHPGAVSDLHARLDAVVRGDRVHGGEPASGLCFPGRTPAAGAEPRPAAEPSPHDRRDTPVAAPPRHTPPGPALSAAPTQRQLPAAGGSGGGLGADAGHCSPHRTAARGRSDRREATAVVCRKSAGPPTSPDRFGSSGRADECHRARGTAPARPVRPREPVPQPVAARAGPGPARGFASGALATGVLVAIVTAVLRIWIK
jgi:hypothetical protein